MIVKILWTFAPSSSNVTICEGAHGEGGGGEGRGGAQGAGPQPQADPHPRLLPHAAAGPGEVTRQARPGAGAERGRGLGGGGLPPVTDHRDTRHSTVLLQCSHTKRNIRIILSDVNLKPKHKRQIWNGLFGTTL